MNLSIVMNKPPRSGIARFLLWQARRQAKPLLFGALWGVVWMLCQATWPFLLGRAIDDGIGFHGNILGWCLLLAGVAVLQAGSAVLRHRMAVENRLAAALGISRLLGHHSAATGHALTAETAAGEIVSTVSSDATRIGQLFEVTARLIGGITAYIVVTCIVMSSSLQLGLVIAIGGPIVVVALALLFPVLHGLQGVWRKNSGMLLGLAADTVVGLRVLRGIGGETEFIKRYDRQSEALRDAGIRVAAPQSWLDGLQVLLPGLLLALLIWLGSRLAVGGQLTAGQLTTLYGYAVFIISPLRVLVECVSTFSAGTVSVHRVQQVLSIEPAAKTSAIHVIAPPSGAMLQDIASGVVIEPGLHTALVSANPDEVAEIATRLGRFSDRVLHKKPVLWGGVDHSTVRLRDVRKRIVVNDAHPHLFAGPLIEGLDVSQQTLDADRVKRVTSALAAAHATDAVDALPAGLDENIAERGRTFSGGQRQRLSLARALLTEAEVLVLIEPTSALDAHTEAGIAERLKTARRNRTTVIVTASPVMLSCVDQIVVVENGRALGMGSHAELNADTGALGRSYRAIVSRRVDEAAENNDPLTGSMDVLWEGAGQ